MRSPDPHDTEHSLHAPHGPYTGHTRSEHSSDPLTHELQEQEEKSNICFDDKHCYKTDKHVFKSKDLKHFLSNSCMVSFCAHFRMTGFLTSCCSRWLRCDPGGSPAFRSPPEHHSDIHPLAHTTRPVRAARLHSDTLQNTSRFVIHQSCVPQQTGEFDMLTLIPA